MIKYLFSTLTLLSLAGCGISDGPSLVSSPSLNDYRWVNTSGDVYIPDSGNYSLRKVTASTGIISRIAGTIGASGSSGDGGAATSAKINYASYVAADLSGNLYLSDSLNHLIRKISSSGVITTIAGVAGASGTGGDGGPASSARMNYPIGIIFDGSNSLYFADSQNSAVRKINLSTGIITTVAGTIGSSGSTGDGGAATSAKLNNPSGIALDASGNLFICDTGNDVVRKVTTSTGIITTVAGTLGVSGSTGDGGAATSAKLSNPSDAVVVQSGDIYIMDSGNSVVRVLNPSTGVIKHFAGVSGVSGKAGDNGAASTAQLANANMIAVDVSGNIFLADGGNQAIRKITPAGVISTPIGVLGHSAGSTGDGGLATSAFFSSPFGFAI